MNAEEEAVDALKRPVPVPRFVHDDVIGAANNLVAAAEQMLKRKYRTDDTGGMVTDTDAEAKDRETLRLALRDWHLVVGRSHETH